MLGRAREGIVAAGVLVVLLLAWLGFFLHRSPRFPGSGLGAMFGIAATVLMLIPLAYPLAKRMPSFNSWITPHLSMKTLLGMHVGAGLLGPLLAIIHTGHRFDSWLGILLTALMLLVVLSGFAVRYLLALVAQKLTDQRAMLQTAQGDLDSAWGMVENISSAHEDQPKPQTWATRFAWVGFPPQVGGPAGEVTRIADSVADLEFSIRWHEHLQRWFRRALNLHIGLSVGFYVLLAAHIAAGVQYGLRWAG